MPQMTPDFDRVVINALLQTDITNYDPLTHLKLSQMVQEIRVSEDYCRADIYLVDCRNSSLGHIPTYTPTLIKKAELCGHVSSENFAHVYNSIKCLKHSVCCKEENI
jgi:hypothetical protein